MTQPYTPARAAKLLLRGLTLPDGWMDQLRLETEIDAPGSSMGNLAPFEELTRLVRLNLWGHCCWGVKRLRAALPNCEVLI